MTNSTKTPQHSIPITTTPHLSDTQIDAHLIGDLAPEAASHLAICDSCKSRAALASEPISAFKSVSLSWSERRSATLPTSLLRTQSPRWSHRAAYAAIAATIVAAATMTTAVHQSHTTLTVASSHTPIMAPAVQIPAVAVQAPTQTPAPQAAISHRAPSPKQIEHDNQMLQAISTELNASLESPNDIIGLTTVSTHPSNRVFSPTTRNWD